MLADGRFARAAPHPARRYAKEPVDVRGMTLEDFYTLARDFHLGGLDGIITALHRVATEHGVGL